MSADIRHLDKQARKDQLNADEARRRALLEQTRSQAYANDGNDGRAETHRREAERLQDKAAELEAEASELMNERQRIEAQVADLQRQRENMIQDHNQKIAQLDKEIQNLNGGMLV